jgi:hydrogenase maturation protein HypF
VARGDDPTGRIRVHIRVTGVVQGVGFRPFVHGLARSLDLVGHVGNDAAGVFAEVEGDPAAVDDFLRRLRDEAPGNAVIERVSVEARDVAGGRGFAIVASREANAAEVALIPPDTAVCADCMAEVLDPADRRHRYPFTACTYCGPRFTLVRGVPYDRPYTTMAGFPLCPDCAREYEDPADRRFHAQPTACPVCGPRLSFRAEGSAEPTSAGDAALAEALRVLRGGGIVAVKGVGGYHLACDARRPEAVARLRERKQRAAKPFAVLVRDLSVAESLGVVDEVAAGLLASPQAPVVLVPVAHAEMARAVAAAVAPGNGSIGLLLPYSPLHHLLLAAHPDLPGPALDALVLTSGNLTDEPLATEPAEADARLAGIADAWLHHDRPIHAACDDSVVRVVDGAAQPVRRSRGYAPLPVRLPLDAPPLLAVGGELKTTLCLASGRRAWMSQHIGDTANLETLELLARVADTLAPLARIEPEAVVADLHPAYLSRGWAERRAAAAGVPLRLVQHHHAHLASLLAEHGVPPDVTVLGFAFDGTGYGRDGSIWGGELLLGGYAAAERVGHLAPVALPGGDAAIRRPARSALAHLHAAGLPWDDRLPAVASADDTERRVVGRMLDGGAGCTPTTSMGRLFDAVAALAGVCQDATYEGQAAIELEALAAVAAAAPGSWRYDVRDEGGALLLDPAPVLRAAVSAVLRGAPAGAVGASFHDATAAAVTEAALLVREQTGVAVVGLTGGVFQNTVLTRACRSRLEDHGLAVLVHRVVPPNDGGLALGQAAVVAAGGGS